MIDRDRLPEDLYTAASVRELDRVAIEELGIPGIVLMKRAGRSCFEATMARWPGARSVTIFCGAGNNGGDGYVIAGLAAQSRLHVQLYHLSPPDGLKGDAMRAYEWASEYEIAMQDWSAGAPVDGDVVVDALLGTGLSGPVRSAYGEAIDAINCSGKPVVAVDIPSGLAADSGAILGCSVRADLTVTFIGMKRGLMTGSGTEMCGDLVYADLDVPPETFTDVARDAELLCLDSLMYLLPRRGRNAHKGDFGHLLIVGGDLGMGGAVALASEAAARTGAGLVSVATRPGHVAALLGRRPEIMVHGVDSRQALEPLMNRFTSVVIGPGLGRSPWSEQLMQLVLEQELPLVIDADGLNRLAEWGAGPRENWVLTPHPGEAARLLDCTTAEIQNDRFGCIEALQQRYGGTIVLKGAGSLIRPGTGTALCPYGNPGMSVGGMGDLLSGVIGGLIAQKLPTSDAARLGTCLHSKAADLVAVSAGERGILAGDLFPRLQQLVNPVRDSHPGAVADEGGERR